MNRGATLPGVTPLKAFLMVVLEMHLNQVVLCPAPFHCKDS